MDLYKRNNIKPFRSIGTLLIQFPIFIALFTAINVSVRPCAVTSDINVPVSRCANHTDTIEYNVNHSAYPFVRSMERVGDLINKQNDYFNDYKENPDEAKLLFEPKLFSAVNLSVSPNQIFADFNFSTVTVALFAIASAVTQYIVARQNDPTRKSGKKRTMRQLMKEAADGKETDQSEINAIAQSQMTIMAPLMMLMIMVNLPGALVFYYFLNNLITTGIQKIILSQNLSEMEAATDKKIIKELKTLEAKEAEIVEKGESEDEPKVHKTKVVSKKSHYSNSKNKKENVHITRISASDNKKKRR
jgi:YidC/Oxa1 family membrane protein insertase